MGDHTFFYFSLSRVEAYTLAPPPTHTLTHTHTTHTHLLVNDSVHNHLAKTISTYFHSIWSVMWYCAISKPKKRLQRQQK